jgi:hypothetical protein
LHLAILSGQGPEPVIYFEFHPGDVLGVLLKASGVLFYKNGTLVGTATALPAGALYPIISLANANDTATANFGATALRYLPQNATSWDGSQTNFGVGWNSADKYTGIQLSNNNLTASYTTTNPSGNVDVRGSIAAQPNRYFEVKFSTLVTGQAHTAGLGLANTTQSLSATPQDPNSAAWLGNGVFSYPGTSGTNWGTFAAGDVLGVLFKSVTTTTGGDRHWTHGDRHRNRHWNWHGDRRDNGHHSRLQHSRFRIVGLPRRR